jgi:hypothetical protein
MDEIDTFKLKALDNMGTTVTALEGELTKAQTYLDRARRGADSGDGAAAAGSGTPAAPADSASGLTLR